MANYNRLKTWTAGEVLTAADLNAEFNNAITNSQPASIDDYSANQSQMRLQTDPGESGSESLATKLSEEIERLRFAIKDVKTKIDPSITYWYQTPTLWEFNISDTSEDAIFLTLDNSNATAVSNGAKIRWQFSDTSANNNLDGGFIGFEKEQNWTSTASTQDSRFTIDIVSNGVLLEAARFTSDRNQELQGLSLKLNSLASAAGSSVILNGVTDGSVTLSSSTSATTGSSIVLYGSTHATKASDLEIRSGSSVHVTVDGPTGLVTVANNLTSTGTFTASNNASVGGTLTLSNAISGSNVVVTSNITAANVTRAKLEAVGQQVSLSSGTFNSTSATYVSVNNLSISITTTGRPVVIFLKSDGNVGNPSYIGGSSGTSIQWRIRRGGGEIASGLLNCNSSPSGSYAFPLSSVYHEDNVGAGTYTYDIQVLNNNSSTVSVINSILTAREL